MSNANWDGQVAQIVPQQIEKIPFYHWKPGIRLLTIGSRDGASFDGDIEAAEANTFHRNLTEDLLVVSQKKMATQGLCMTMSNNLCFPKNMRMAHKTAQGFFTMASPGYGNPSVYVEMQQHLDATLLLMSDVVTDLAKMIIESAVHVEILLGIDKQVPDLSLPWESIAAVHLCSLRPMHNAEQRQRWHQQARAMLPDSTPIYDEDHSHTICTCGETLVWRSGGRSRLDALDPQTGACTACARPSTIVL